MRKVFQHILFVVLASCTFGPGGYNQSATLKIIQASIDEENSRKRSVRSSGKRKRSSSYKASRGERCEDDEDCFDICDTLYNNDGAVEECGELKVSVVEEMEQIVDALRDDDITVKELERFDEDLFDEMLEISVYPWVYTVRRRVDKRSHAKTLLAWIASNSDIFRTIEEYDRKADFSSDYQAYEGFARLLDEVGSGSSQCEKYCDALTEETIGAGQSFRDLRGGSTLAGMYASLPQDLNRDNGGTCRESGVSCTTLGTPPRPISTTPDTTPSTTNPPDTTGPSRNVINSAKDQTVAITSFVTQCGSSEDVITVRECMRNERCREQSDPAQCAQNCHTTTPDCEIANSIGTGVFIEHEGERKVLTNHHVIEDALQIAPRMITTSIFQQEFSTVIENDNEDEVLLGDVESYANTGCSTISNNGNPIGPDLALITLATSLSGTDATLGNFDDLEVGDMLFTFGTPTFFRFIYSDGNLTRKRSTCPNDFYHSVETGGGNSGGGIFNSDGELVGLHKGSITGYDQLKVATPIGMIQQFLRDGGTTPSSPYSSVLELMRSRNLERAVRELRRESISAKRN